MRFGIHLPHAGPGATAAGVLDVARAAETAGYGSVWLFDHLFTPTRGEQRYPFSVDGAYPMSSEEPYLDAVGLMGALSAVTERVEIGVRVLIPAYRHPVVLAKELSTIDAVAGGRLVVGVGAGWMPEEFAATGIPMERRAARMTEHVALMRNVWQHGTAAFAGEFFHHVEAGFHPRPPRGTIPILVGGYGDAALRRVAVWGDGWAVAIRTEQTITNPHSAVDPEVLAARLALLRSYCEEVGRDYAGVRLVIAASPRDDIGVLRAYAELGIHDCDLMVWGESAKVIHVLRRFADEVGTEIGCLDDHPGHL